MSDETNFDPDKDAINRQKHGLSLDRFPTFDDVPQITVDDRADYGEVRYRAVGRIAGLGHMVVFAIRNERIRIISFRRAHEKELRRYER